jgi:hypothetical protein
VKFEPLEEAADVYLAGSACDVHRIGVEAVEASTFFERLRELDRAISDLRADEYWSEGFGYFRRRRYFIQSTPLNVSDPALELLAYVVRAREHFTTCRSLYPEHADGVEQVCDGLMDLLMSNIDPLSDAVVDAFAEYETDRVGVVLPTFGFDKLVQRHLRRRTDSEIDAVTPRDLAMRRPYDVLFVIGRPWWYVGRRWGWVYTAPRASALVMVGYEDHMRERLPSSRAFSDSVTAVAPVRDTAFVDVAPSDEADEAGVDWSFMSGEVARRAVGADSADLVEARLYLLAAGFAAFLSASEESRVPTVEPDAPEDGRLVYVPAPEIGPGSIVLLRSEGGGDFIVAVADAILGPAAGPLRAIQETWKSRLRALVEERGAAGVVAELKGHGSMRANRSNLANWCSPRSLRTEDERDFLAIIRAISLDGQAAQYWEAMARLESAHRRAGHEIRDQLERQARTADLTALEEEGRADFSLPQGGGALTAFRVEEISPEIVAVPYQHLGDPFEARA